MWAKFRFQEAKRKTTGLNLRKEPALMEFRFVLPFACALPLITYWATHGMQEQELPTVHSSNVLPTGLCFKALRRGEVVRKFRRAQDAQHIANEDAKNRLSTLLDAEDRGVLLVEVRVPHQMLDNSKEPDDILELLHGIYDRRTRGIAKHFKEWFLRCVDCDETESLVVQAQAVVNGVTETNVDLNRCDEYNVAFI